MRNTHRSISRVAFSNLSAAAIEDDSICGELIVVYSFLRDVRPAHSRLVLLLASTLVVLTLCLLRVLALEMLAVVFGLGARLLLLLTAALLVLASWFLSVPALQESAVFRLGAFILPADAFPSIASLDFLVLAFEGKAVVGLCAFLLQAHASLVLAVLVFGGAALQVLAIITGRARVWRITLAKIIFVIFVIAAVVPVIRAVRGPRLSRCGEQSGRLGVIAIRPVWKVLFLQLSAFNSASLLCGLVCV